MFGQTQHNLVRRETDIGLIPPSLVTDFHAYWLAKRGTWALPSWSDIDPSEIKRLLPNLIVAGVEYDPLRIRYRLAGTMIVEFRGEITGHYLGQIPWSSPKGQATVLEGFTRNITERIPLFNEVEIATRHGARRKIFTGVWPLAPRDDAPIDRCVAIEDYGNLTRDELA
ncbi:PAS domain-containing protein [Dongia sp.]|uniref:PAS domain-containing protein n=1 Tax=Dongia sp. TaxID=1977262 RepID=UPI0035B294D0